MRAEDEGSRALGGDGEGRRANAGGAGAAATGAVVAASSFAPQRMPLREKARTSPMNPFMPWKDRRMRKPGLGMTIVSSLRSGRI
jgi:hypothetical protein